MLQDLTRATGMGFCISQLPLTLFVIIYYREPHATLYSVDVMNKTSLDVRLNADDYGLSVLFLISSSLVVVFSMMTSQLQEAQMIDNVVEYNDEVATQVTLWTNTLWALIFTEHFVVISILSAPVDLYFLFLVCFVQTFSISLTCAPRKVQKTDTFALLIFISVVGLIFLQMHSTHGLKLIIWMAQVLGDVLLIMGHTYDHVCNMETVANCRVFYCCFVSCLLILLYIC